MNVGVFNCVDIKGKGDLRFVEALSVVENVCCALLVAQDYTVLARGAEELLRTFMNFEKN